MSIRPVIKYHGGKYYLSEWIISNFPVGYENMLYGELFCGGASVFFNKKPSLRPDKKEILNDTNLPLVSIYRVLENPTKLLSFIRTLERLEYSEKVFLENLQKRNRLRNSVDSFELALNEFILCRMSRGGLKKSFAWSERLRGGQPGDLNAWETCLAGLPAAAARLKNTVILNTDALALIYEIKTSSEYEDDYQKGNILLYLDPPYMTDTRVSKKVYYQEMTGSEHADMFNLLKDFKGKILVSGYDSYIYSRLYKNWNKVEKKIVNHSSQKKTKETKTEILWKNF